MLYSLPNMPTPLQHLIDRLRRSEPSTADRLAVHTLARNLRNERRDLLARIGEQVAVWHRAGEQSNRLLTEHLRTDLERLGAIEEQLERLLLQLASEEGGLPGEYLQPTSSFLAEADTEPTVLNPPASSGQPATPAPSA